MDSGEPTKRKTQCGSRTAMKCDNRAGRYGSGRVSIRSATLVGSRNSLGGEADRVLLWLENRPVKVSNECCSFVIDQ